VFPPSAAMIRHPVRSAARPAPVEWQAAVLKHIQTAASEAMVEEAKRMGSALAAMREKDKPTAKDAVVAKVKTRHTKNAYKR